MVSLFDIYKSFINVEQQYSRQSYIKLGNRMKNLSNTVTNQINQGISKSIQGQIMDKSYSNQAFCIEKEDSKIFGFPIIEKLNNVFNVYVCLVKMGLSKQDEKQHLKVEIKRIQFNAKGEDEKPIQTNNHPWVCLKQNKVNSSLILIHVRCIQRMSWEERIAIFRVDCLECEVKQDFQEVQFFLKISEEVTRCDWHHEFPYFLVLLHPEKIQIYDVQANSKQKPVALSFSAYGIIRAVDFTLSFLSKHPQINTLSILSQDGVIVTFAIVCPKNKEIMKKLTLFLGRIPIDSKKMCTLVHLDSFESLSTYTYSKCQLIDVKTEKSYKFMFMVGRSSQKKYIRVFLQKQLVFQWHFLEVLILQFPEKTSIQFSLKNVVKDGIFITSDQGLFFLNMNLLVQSIELSKCKTNTTRLLNESSDKLLIPFLLLPQRIQYISNLNEFIFIVRKGESYRVDFIDADLKDMTSNCRLAIYRQFSNLKDSLEQQIKLIFKDKSIQSESVSTELSKGMEKSIEQTEVDENIDKKMRLIEKISEVLNQIEAKHKDIMKLRTKIEEDISKIQGRFSGVSQNFLEIQKILQKNNNQIQVLTRKISRQQSQLQLTAKSKETEMLFRRVDHVQDKNKLEIDHKEPGLSQTMAHINSLRRRNDKLRELLGSGEDSMMILNHSK